MNSPERSEVKGHTLKKIRIRLDYFDLIKVPVEAIKDIQKVCVDFGLKDTTFRAIQPSDFDMTAFEDEVNIPYEYIKDLKSRVFLNEDQSLILEVNQFFIQITQNVLSHDGYIRFSDMNNIMRQASSKLQEHENMISVRKLSVQKINEIFYNNMDNMSDDFNLSYLGLDAYNEYIDWHHPFSRLEKKNSFAFKDSDSLIEVLTVLDNGQIEEDEPPILRIILQFENFVLGKFKELPLDKIVELNSDIYEVFLKSFTVEGQTRIKNGERLGDYW